MKVWIWPTVIILSSIILITAISSVLLYTIINPEEIDRISAKVGFEIIMIPIALVIIVEILAVLIIALSKKRSSMNEVDFVVHEEMYGIDTEVDVNEAEAQTDMSGEEFNFNYDLYKILGIEPSATGIEIKKSYRKMAAYYHPDRVAINKDVDHDETGETMLRINKAKEVLLDPERKARYDAQLDELDFEINL